MNSTSIHPCINLSFHFIIFFIYAFLDLCVFPQLIFHLSNFYLYFNFGIHPTLVINLFLY